MNSTLVLLHCMRCHARATVKLQLAIDEDGDLCIPVGTLENEWALRWRRSHAGPNHAHLVETP